MPSTSGDAPPALPGIDQTNISENLASLPVFLASCRKLLVICGPSYLQRLWCIVELFVFIEMGGREEQIDVRFTEGYAMDPVSFDVHTATCSNALDRERLLSTIEYGFRDLDSFNQHIVRLFTNIVARGSGPAPKKRPRGDVTVEIPYATPKPGLIHFP